MTSAVAILARAALARGRKPRTTPLPTTEAPRAVDRAYLRELLELLRLARAAVEAELVAELEVIVREAAPIAADSLVTDRASDRIERTMQRVRLLYGKTVTPEDFIRIVERAGWRVADVNRLRTQRQFKMLLGLDVLRDNAALADLVSSFTKENVALITSVHERYFTEVETLVQRNVRAGVRSDALAREIAERFNVTESRAAFIARDQTGKLNGDITRARQTAVGVTHYIWRTAKDELVRPGHVLLEGQVIPWKEPPIVDAKSGRRAHPGGDFRCRCTAEPVIPGLNEGPRPRVPAKVRATPRRLVPEGVPEGYGRHALAPAGKFSLDRLRAAFPQGLAGKPTRAQQITMRREVNAALAEHGLVERGILGNVLAEQRGRVAGELAAAKDVVERARLELQLRDIDARMTSTGFPMYREGEHLGTVGVSNDPRYRGTHQGITGEIKLRSDVMRDVVGFVRTPSAQRTESMVNGMRTLVHETMHGHSPMHMRVYQGVGVRLEEATNEMAAHVVTEQLAPGFSFGAPAIGPGRIEGSYASYIGAAVRAVADGLDVTHQKATEYARAASLAMRRYTGPLFRDADSYAHHFARQLPGLRMKVARAERAAAAELDAEVAAAKAAGDVARGVKLEGERHGRLHAAGAKVTQKFVALLLRELGDAPSY